MSDNKLKKYAKMIPFVIAIASAIAAVTPGDTDDKIVKLVKQMANVAALNVMNATPESHKE